jgi:hypothetical protein
MGIGEERAYTLIININMNINISVNMNMNMIDSLRDMEFFIIILL